MKTKKEIFLLSCLTEEAIWLGMSVLDYSCESKNACRVICAVTDEDAAARPSLIRECKNSSIELTGADIVSLTEKYMNGNRLFILLMSTDEKENVACAIRLNHIVGSMSNVCVICKATSIESECVIDNINIANYTKTENPAKFLRIHPERTEIYQWLFEHSLFDYSQKILDENWISCLCVGYGKYSSEFVKAFLWCGQMDGYYIRADIIDTNQDTEDRFAYECPGIIERKNEPRMGEDYYDLEIHTLKSFQSLKMLNLLDKLQRTSLIVIDTGNDGQNIEIALKIRSYLSGKTVDKGELPDHSQSSTQKPRILAVVSDDESGKLIDGNSLVNYRGQYYQIECVGSMSKMYSAKNIIFNPLEDLALRAHLEYGKEADFWKFEYFRRSSMASSIHKKYRDEFLHDAAASAMVEHRRWCAYMRSTEGYRYGITRDDLAKRHPSLTAYDNLTKVEQAKDYAMDRVKLAL